MGNLDEDTRLQGSDGNYTANVSPAWEIWGPNGGYMAALALRAGGAEARIKRPVSFYCQFLRVARYDRIDAKVSGAQRGRRSEALRISLVQDDKPVLEALLAQRAARRGAGARGRARAGGRGSREPAHVRGAAPPGVAPLQLLGEP